MNNPQRIGIYGGTFDPIHKTHVDAARAALGHAHLDVVFFVVAASPPHKRGEVFADAEDRLDMVCAAIADEPGMEASRIEMDRCGPSYTVDTLQELEGQYPGAHFFLILGQDSLSDLLHWRDPQGILSRAQLLVVPRPGIVLPPPRQLEGGFALLPFEESDLSSSDIRDRLCRGQAVWGCLAAGVQQIIRERGLYQTCPS